MTANVPLFLIYSPFPSPEAAQAAAHTLLTERCVACCNILPATQAHYWWEGALTQATETVLLCKTTPEKLAVARARIEALHPYDCPAILTLPAEANAAFAGWAASATNL
jgi:periplasmic divalent cation tolerance protein